MRTLTVVLVARSLLLAQTDVPQTTVPAAPEAPAAPQIRVDVAPLAPPELESPYASPRDAARHRLQVTLADLQSSRDVKAAIRGFAEALGLDRTYAPAAWNLAIVAALAEKWLDAVAALEEAGRLDPAGLGKPAAPQIERLRLIASLARTPEGQRKLQYDVALFPVVERMTKAASADSMAALSAVGRLDPKRWEAPALLGGLNGDGHNYEVAAKFLEIAASNASDPAIRSALEKARRAAERELSYLAARASAEAAADRGEYKKAAEFYQNAWTTIPARTSTGMDAAANWLVEDDTAHATGVLLRLRESGDSELAGIAGQMLQQVSTIEPAVAQAPADSATFFRDAGPADPVHIGDLLPRVDTTAMEVLTRPLPRLLDDPEPAVLLAALAADRVAGAPPVLLPVLPPARIVGDQPWIELQALRPPVPKPVERSRQSVELSGDLRNRRILSVTTQPAGAQIFVEDAKDPVCQSPCDIQVASGSYEIRTMLAGFESQSAIVHAAGPRTDVDQTLNPARGRVLVETPVPAPLKINGTAVAGTTPLELWLNPGLYRIAVQFGSADREQSVMVKPDAHLRLRLQP